MSTSTPTPTAPSGSEAPEKVSPRTERLLRIATKASLAAACVLIACKSGAWIVTGSMSILATLIDSIMDIAASMVNFLAVRQALQPADTDHRFGHGKAEPLAGLAQAAFVSGTSLFLVIEAFVRMYNPVIVVNEGVGIGVMVFAIVVTLILVAFQTYVVRETKSAAISADSLHYKGDVLIHGSVILSLWLGSKFGVSYLDPLFGIAIAAYLMWSAKAIVASALHSLMDRELSEEDRTIICDLALAHPEVCDIHDLRTRSAGPRSFIQFHLELPQDISLLRAHVISDAVEADVRAAFPGAGIIIHQDPEGVPEHRATFVGEPGT